MTTTALPRLAEDCALLVRGEDAVVLREGVEVLSLPGAGEACGWLGHSGLAAGRDWLAAPTSVRRLVAILETHGVLATDPLTGHLMDLHAQTVGGRFQRPADAGSDTAFLVREYGEPGIPLPPADLGSMSLAAALRSRRSARPVGGRPLALGALGTLLEAAVRRTDDGALTARSGPMGPLRAHPSGGALYLVETLVIVLNVDDVPPATYRYHPLTHSLSERAPATAVSDIEIWFSDLSGGAAAVVALLTVDLGRPSLSRYGGKAYRLALLEAGHIAQNLLLVGTALDLPGLPLCGFDADAVPAAAGLGATEVAVYAVAFGSAPSQDPASADRRANDRD